MELHEAAKVTARYAAGKKAPPALQCVRFLPAMGSLPPRLYATDGLSGMFAPVDVQNLPDVLVPAEDLAAVGRESAVIGLWDEAERTLVQTGAGTFALRKVDVSIFPPLPPIPESMEALIEWSTVSKVLHAAGEVPGRPELGYVHFHKDRVEATDSVRVAMADVTTPIETMIPASMFKQLPKTGDVWVAVKDQWVYLKIGGQLRVAVSGTGRSPECRQYLDQDHIGNWMVVDSKTILNAVKKASKVDPIVRLQFGMLSIHVSGRCKDNEREFWSEVNDEDYSKVKATRGLTAGQTGVYPNLNLYGDKLIEALKVVDTPNVRLCYSNGDDKPLRIESGGYVEAIWTVLE